MASETQSHEAMVVVGCAEAASYDSYTTSFTRGYVAGMVSVTPASSTAVIYAKAGHLGSQPVEALLLRQQLLLCRSCARLSGQLCSTASLEMSRKSQ